jgi:hypothetical protein
VIDGGVPISCQRCRNSCPSTTSTPRSPPTTSAISRPTAPPATCSLQRRYDSLHQYNSNAVLLGVDTPWRFGHWTLRGGLTSTGDPGRPALPAPGPAAGAVGPPRRCPTACSST